MQGYNQGMRRRAELLSSAAVLVLGLMAGAQSATAQQLYDFDIPRGDVNSVVTAIARAGGTSIAFPASIASGIQVGPVKGRESLRQALDRALAGSGLEVATAAGGRLTIRKAAGAPTSGVKGDVATIDVTDASTGAHRDEGFKAGDAGTTVRIADAPLKEVPIAVSAVTNSVLTSQSITTTTDAVRNVAGVNIVKSFEGDRPDFTIRGFPGGGYTVDGQGRAKFDTIPVDQVDRVEVLKGPTSILTGASADGGLVNVVLKKPTDVALRNATVRFGTNGAKTIALDMGGPLAGLQGLTYRFVGSANQADKSFAGYENPSQYLLAPAVKWQVEALTLSASLSHKKSRSVPSSRAALITDGWTFDPETERSLPYPHRLLKLPAIPFGNPNIGTDAKSTTFNTEQNYDFGKIGNGFGLSFNNVYEYSVVDSTRHGISYDNSAPDYVQSYAMTQSLNRTELFSEKPSLTLSYEGAFAKSNLKVGYDYTRILSDQKFGASDRSSIDLSNGYDPLLNMRIVPLYRGPATELNNTNFTRRGVYVVEKLDLFNDRLHMLGSLRYDWNHSQSRSNADPKSRSESQGKSYVLGAVYDITSDLSAYVNRSDGFVPGGSAGGVVIPPQGRTLSEAGLRSTFFDKRLAATLSFYELTQTNLSSFDNSQLPPLLLTGAGLRTRGAELEIQGEILPGWNVIASATRLLPKSLRSTNIDVAAASPTFDPASGNPGYQGSLWTTYAFSEGWARGFTIGAGARAVSDSKVQYNTEDGHHRLPGYVIADAMVQYERDNFSVNFKLNNIFNKKAIMPVQMTRYMGFEDGRNWTVTANYKF